MGWTPTEVADSGESAPRADSRSRAGQLQGVLHCPPAATASRSPTRRQWSRGSPLTSSFTQPDKELSGRQDIEIEPPFSRPKGPDVAGDHGVDGARDGDLDERQVTAIRERQRKR